MNEAIVVENFNNTIVIRFNRPQERNPLSIAVLEKIESILENINPNVEAMIFTGTNDVFASGADLREIAKVTKDTAKEFALRGQNLMNKIAAMEQTTIAAINGYCFGGALDLALACDKRIASPNAQFSHPGANLGIITGWGGTQRLPRLIGEAKALEMFLTAKRVSADEALQIGLIDKIAGNPLAEGLAFILD
ncbi:MAG: enoyl-CoA hydratase/isomerase family protein [Acidobacteria bacterium]|nr:enoyl-CoA hydratase/isomerase family protein [Acidobacteriota bacterium]MCA1636879.1 enoyl-CoA hydratase/isomerase family protein [Acidobacteriota bacterium]